MNRSHGRFTGWGSPKARVVVPALLLATSVIYLVLAVGHSGNYAAALAVTALLLCVAALGFAMWVSGQSEPARVVIDRRQEPPYLNADHPDRPRNSRPRAPGC